MVLVERHDRNMEQEAPCAVRENWVSGHWHDGRVGG